MKQEKAVYLLDLTYKQEIFLSRKDEGFEGSGYDKTSLAKVFLKEKMPKALDYISFTPEKNVYCVRAGLKTVLDFSLAFKQTYKNETFMLYLFSRVTSN